MSIETTNMNNNPFEDMTVAELRLFLQSETITVEVAEQLKDLNLLSLNELFAYNPNVSADAFELMMRAVPLNLRPNSFEALLARHTDATEEQIQGLIDRVNHPADVGVLETLFANPAVTAELINSFLDTCSESSGNIIELHTNDDLYSVIASHPAVDEELDERLREHAEWVEGMGGYADNIIEALDENPALN